MTWYAVFTAPQREKRVERELQGQGFDAYCPEETIWRGSGPRRAPAQHPLLVRYLFVDLDAAGPRFDLVRQTDGVGYVVGVSGTPYPVPDAFVSKLREMQTLGELDRTKPPPRIAFRPGQPVQIVKGRFKGALGQFMAATHSEDRVRIMLAGIFAGGMEIDPDHLRVA